MKQFTLTQRIKGSHIEKELRTKVKAENINEAIEILQNMGFKILEVNSTFNIFTVE